MDEAHKLSRNQHIHGCRLRSMFLEESPSSPHITAVKSAGNISINSKCDIRRV